MNRPRPLIGPSAEHLKVIGLIAVYWSFVERTVEMILWTLTPLKQLRAQAVTTHLGLRTRADIIRSLAHMSFPDTPTEQQLNNLLGRMESELAPKRNNVIHGGWGPASDPSKASLFVMRARGPIKMWSEDYSPEELDAIAGEINDLNYELAEVAFEVQRLTMASDA